MSPRRVVASGIPGAVSKSSFCLTALCAVKQPKDFRSLPRTEGVDQDAALQPEGDHAS